VTAYRMVTEPVTGHPDYPVVFRIAAPADVHEARMALIVSRPAWESQGSPEEITVELTTEVR
jgi:hypothetical protein